MRQLVLALLLVLGLTAVLMVVGLFAVRLGREVHERRREARHREVRTVILTALMGEPDEAGLARTELRSRTGPAWAQVEDQAFAMIPKVKGDSHDALVSLLHSGAVQSGFELFRADGPGPRSAERAAHTGSARSPRPTPSPCCWACCATRPSSYDGPRCVPSARSGTRSRCRRCSTRSPPTRG